MNILYVLNNLSITMQERSKIVVVGIGLGALLQFPLCERLETTLDYAGKTGSDQRNLIHASVWVTKVLIGNSELVCVHDGNRRCGDS